MFPIALFIIIITIAISYKGIEDKNFFEKYKFNISIPEPKEEEEEEPVQQEETDIPEDGVIGDLFN